MGAMADSSVMACASLAFHSVSRWANASLFFRQELIRSKIRAKFKNARHASNEEKLVEERVAKRIKLTTSKEKQAAAGLPMYDPGLDNPTAEDIQKLYKLKTQYNALPDAEKEELKKSTYPLRRWYLLKTKEPLERLKERFPWVFEEGEVRVVTVLFVLITGYFWADMCVDPRKGIWGLVPRILISDQM